MDQPCKPQPMPLTFTCPLCGQPAPLDRLFTGLRNRILVGIGVRCARERAKFTQAQLADAVGCSREFIALVEIGQRALPLVRAMQVAQALHTTADAMFSSVVSDGGGEGGEE